jgi:hypothetical protein
MQVGQCAWRGTRRIMCIVVQVWGPSAFTAPMRGLTFGRPALRLLLRSFASPASMRNLANAEAWGEHLARRCRLRQALSGDMQREAQAALRAAFVSSNVAQFSVGNALASAEGGMACEWSVHSIARLQCACIVLAKDHRSRHLLLCAHPEAAGHRCPCRSLHARQGIATRSANQSSLVISFRCSPANTQISHAPAGHHFRHTLATDSSPRRRVPAGEVPFRQHPQPPQHLIDTTAHRRAHTHCSVLLPCSSCARGRTLRGTFERAA